MLSPGYKLTVKGNEKYSFFNKSAPLPSPFPLSCQVASYMTKSIFGFKQVSWIEKVFWHLSPILCCPLANKLLAFPLRLSIIGIPHMTILGLTGYWDHLICLPISDCVVHCCLTIIWIHYFGGFHFFCCLYYSCCKCNQVYLLFSYNLSPLSSLHLAPAWSSLHSSAFLEFNLWLHYWSMPVYPSATSEISDVL